LLQAVGEAPQQRTHRLRWSHFRRQHQAQARHFHVLRRVRQAPPVATQVPAPLPVPGLPALTDEHWQHLRRLLPPQKPQTGRPATDHRLIVEAMLWVASSGSCLSRIARALRTLVDCG
jgi:hypothetical protein